MEKQNQVETAQIFPCMMCRMVFQIFRAALFIYFGWFILNVLLSKFPSPGELIYNLREYFHELSKIPSQTEYLPENFK
jgi:hypothetical protein